MIRLGFDSKANFAKSQLLSRSTVTKFFQREPIQRDSFERICEKLTLNWKEVADILEEELGTNEGEEQVQTVRRVTVIDEQSQTVKAALVLNGDINSVSNLKIIESILREYSGSTIKIIDIQEGSIKLIVEGFQEDIERLISRIQSGELVELNGFPVEDIQILSDESTKVDDKWQLVQEIVSQPVAGRDLRGADLSDTDLSGANLSGADLSDADLSGADLSDANLSNANLMNANLSSSDLSGANLSSTNLSNAGLRFTDLSSTNLTSTDLSGSDLRDTNLINANLRNSNLIGADLRNAIINTSTKLDDRWYLVWRIVTHGAEGQDLKHADLRSADLRSANFRGCDLRYANLRGSDLRNANLIDADLRGTNVQKVLFGDNAGISESLKQELIRRGAIFQDFSGNRSEILATG
ncbi:pentapeptide repeat-containing protein [Scytonema sp. UIC 10036]|nr:pentapeptide repeat-containing protein [Scytonema sp. UIC 10036]